MRARLAIPLSLALAVTGELASASPSVWEVARQPKLAAEYRTLVSVEAFLLGHASAWDEMNVHKGTIDYLRGERYFDPRVELLLGQLRVETTLRGEQGVRERLEATLSRHADSPLAPRAFLELARIAAMQGDLEAARQYFSNALERAWQPDLRASAYYGRAKVTMEAGRPQAALADYRVAVARAHRPKTRALAHWGYGVALERAGNLNAAFVQLRLATQIRVRSTAFVARTVLDLPDVFFSPDFDKFYYKALASMAAADASDVPAQAILDYQTAVQFFARYSSEADQTEHAYTPNARRLQKLCEAAIKTLKLQSAAEQEE